MQDLNYAPASTRLAAALRAMLRQGRNACGATLLASLTSKLAVSASLRYLRRRLLCKRRRKRGKSLPAKTKSTHQGCLRRRDLPFLKHSRNARKSQICFISSCFSYILEKTMIHRFFFGDLRHTPPRFGSSIPRPKERKPTTFR